jgi:hypothetical protein
MQPFVTTMRALSEYYNIYPEMKQNIIISDGGENLVTGNSFSEVFATMPSLILTSEGQIPV